MSSDAAKKKTWSLTVYGFIKVIECFQCLARQEQAMQGIYTDDESNFTDSVT